MLQIEIKNFHNESLKQNEKWYALPAGNVQIWIHTKDSVAKKFRKENLRFQKERGRSHGQYILKGCIR